MAWARPVLGASALIAAILLGAAVLLTTDPTRPREAHQISLAQSAPSPGLSDLEKGLSTFHKIFADFKAAAPAASPNPSPQAAAAVGKHTAFTAKNIFVISLNTTVGRSRLLATGKRLGKHGIDDFNVLTGINGNAPARSADRHTLWDYITGRSSHALLADSRCCCWNGVRFADNTPSGKNYVMSSAEGACFVSHMKVWQALVKSDQSWALVFEDDASLTSSFPTGHGGTIKFPPFPDDAEMVMFNHDGYSSYTGKTTGSIKYREIKLSTDLPTTGFEGYAISKKAAARLLDTKNYVVPLLRPLDWLVLELGRPSDQRTAAMKAETKYNDFRLTIYSSNPPVVYTADADRATSEIGKYSPESGSLQYCNKSWMAPHGATS